MKKRRQYLDPEELTSEEMVERIVELLAIGVIRLLKEGPSVSKSEKTKGELLSHRERAPVNKGRMPFGQRKDPVGRVFDPNESDLIERIRRLAGEGFSSEKIARRLNEKDRSSQAGRKMVQDGGVADIKASRRYKIIP